MIDILVRALLLGACCFVVGGVLLAGDMMLNPRKTIHPTSQVVLALLTTVGAVLVIGSTLALSWV